jgi:hypothetical protein
MKLASLFAAAAIAAASPASAMTYSWRAIGDHIVIDAAGDIELNEKTAFASWIEYTHQNWGGLKATAIILNSDGGSVVGGDGLAGVIYQHHLLTGVAHGGFCASACVEVWASGVIKTVPFDGRIGVHHATVQGNDDQADNGTRYMVNVYRRLGAPASVIDATITTASSDIHWLTRHEYAAWSATIIP